MVRISLQFSGFWRSWFSKGEGIFATFQTFSQEIPKLAKLESSLMLILFLFIKEGFLGGLILVARGIFYFSDK